MFRSKKKKLELKRRAIIENYIADIGNDQYLYEYKENLFTYVDGNSLRTIGLNTKNEIVDKPINFDIISYKMFNRFHPELYKNNFIESLSKCIIKSDVNLINYDWNGKEEDTYYSTFEKVFDDDYSVELRIPKKGGVTSYNILTNDLSYTIEHISVYRDDIKHQLFYRIRERYSDGEDVRPIIKDLISRFENNTKLEEDIRKHKNFLEQCIENTQTL